MPKYRVVLWFEARTVITVEADDVTQAEVVAVNELAAKPGLESFHYVECGPVTEVDE